MKTLKYRVLLLAVVLFTVTTSSWADRGRPFLLTLPTGEGREGFIAEWNAELGKNFDLVMNGPNTPDPFADLASITAGETAWLMTSTAGAEALVEQAPSNIAWIFLDLYNAPASSDVASEVAAAAALAQPRQWSIALLPPAGRAAELGPVLAPHLNAFIIPLDGSAETAIDTFPPIADSVARANGRCRLGVYLTESSLDTEADVTAWLPFYDGSDEIVHFYAGPWPSNGESLSRAVHTLNVDIAGPKPSQGMHADRFRAPDVPMDPQTEKRIRHILSAASVLLLIAVPLFVYFASRAKKPS